jgi:hypothetical protein
MLNARTSKTGPMSSAAAVLLLCAGLSACALHWPPWRHRPPPAPTPVQELSIESAAVPAPQILQFWDRNTLLLDLTAVNGEGEVTLRAPAGPGWPVRLEFRVQPGSIQRLEVQGRERVLFEVPAQGTPMVLKLSPSAYLRDTPQITLRWSAADGSAR